MSRQYRIYDGDELIEEGFNDISWELLRRMRDALLRQTDNYAMGDRVLSDEMRDYRQFLRDLPQNHPGDNANDAVDAWTEYDVPEVE